jgi:hypothetical protein
MVTAVGVLACILLAVLPAAVCPERHVLIAAVTAAFVSAAGLLMPSLGVTMTGAVGSVLVFSVALVISSAGNAVAQAILLGLALFALLNATHYRLRFHRASVDASVPHKHLLDLAASTGLSLALAMLAVALAAVASIRFELLIRPVLAATGVALVTVAALRALQGTSAGGPPESDLSE